MASGLDDEASVRAGARLLPFVLRFVVVALASFLLGALTVFAQGWLPDEWRSFANSASGWTLLTALMAFASRAKPSEASLLGALSFVILVLGYSAGATWIGLHYSPLIFVVVGVVVGPFIGLAAAWLRDHGWRAAAATALLSGIFVGESVYGLTVVADTTAPHYWVAIGALGVALLAGMLGWRIRGGWPVTIATVGTALVAAGFIAAYTLLGVL
ncbi:MAG: DUF6518 family protein [Homoserinimonas sp.]|nr:DUF6518 family protein [Homoserinimonas sp.]